VIEFQAVRMAIENDGEGRLVFVEGRLAAIAVRLSAEHGALSGRWFLEAAFGSCQAPVYPTFNDLDALGEWVQGCFV